MTGSPMRLWLAWVGVNGLGGMLAFLLGAGAFLVGLVPLLALWPSDAPRPPVAIVLTLLWGLAWPLLTGAALFGAQWLLLRRLVPDLDAGGWLLRGAILWVAGGVAAGLLLYLVEMGPGVGRSTAASILHLGMAGLAVGAVVGVGQWMALDGRLPDAYLLLGAVPLGYALGAAGTGALVEALWPYIRPLGAAAEVLVIAALGGGIGGTISGAVSGLVVARSGPAAPPPSSMTT